MNQKTRALVVLIAGFVLLGMPGSALSVAWPSVADDLGRNLGDLGVLTVVTGTGYALVSVMSGSITKRMSAGLVLVGGAVAAAVGLGVYSFADGWGWFVVGAIPIGIAGGALDSIGNAYVAVRHGARPMGLIHAAFGFGSMLAPLFMTALVALGMSWRVGFMGLAVAQLALAVAMFVVASVIRMPMEGHKDRPVRGGSTVLLGASVWTFFIYAGMEGSTGFWAYTLLTEGQGVSVGVAGVAIAAHWAALFVSRLLLGILGDRIPPRSTVTASGIGIVVGLSLLWWNPTTPIAIAGLVLAGFANGPVFPLEVTLTRRRFGEAYTPWAVGYQLSAATVAIAIVPAVIGILVNLSGPAVIGAALVVLSLIVLVSLEGLRVISVRSEAVGLAEPAHTR